MERFVTVYSYNDEGLFVGMATAQRDKNAELMMPDNTTSKKPLDKEGHQAFFNGERWFYRQIPTVKVVVPEVTELNYAETRALEYPFTGDQLDAVFKAFKYLRDEGEQLPEETLSWISKIEKVKTKYPKVAA